MFYYICNLTSESNAKLFFETYKKNKNISTKKRYAIAEHILNNFNEEKSIHSDGFKYIHSLIHYDPKLLYQICFLFYNKDCYENNEDLHYHYINLIKQIIINFNPNKQQFIFLCKILDYVFFKPLFLTHSKKFKLSVLQKNYILKFVDSRMKISKFNIKERILFESSMSSSFTLLLNAENIQKEPNFINYVIERLHLYSEREVIIILLHYFNFLPFDKIITILDFVFENNLTTKENVIKKLNQTETIFINYEQHKLNQQLNDF